MGLEINRAFSVGALQPNTRVDRNRHNAYFGTELNADTFQSTSVKYYVTEPSIRKAIGANPKIHAIVKDFNPEMKLNIEELNDLLKIMRLIHKKLLTELRTICRFHCGIKLI